VPALRELVTVRLHASLRRLVAWRPTRGTLVLAVILCAALLLRLAAYDHPLGNNGGDGFNDYLTASHALTYGEWPVLGPSNDFLPLIKESPFYYYFIAALIAIHNTPGFLGFCFILLECATITGLFCITRRLFGLGPAIIAGCWAAFAPRFISDEIYLWQPYVVEPFVVLAAFLFVKGYQSASQVWLALSLVAMLAAVAVHFSALGVLPVYLIVLCIAVYRLDGYAGIGKFVLIACAAFALFFALPILHPFQQNFLYIKFPSSSSASLIDHLRPDVLLGQLQETLRYFGAQFVFGPPSGTWRTPIELCAALFSALSVSYFVLPDVARERKYALAILILCTLQQLIAVAFLGIAHQTWEMLPAKWAALAVLATLVYEVVRRTRWLWPVWTIFGGMLLYSIAYNPFLDSVISNIPAFAQPHQVSMDKAVTAMSANIDSIKTTQHYRDYHFFTIEVFRKGTQTPPVLPAIFWTPLEERFGVQFMTAVYYNSGFSLHVTSPSRYIFLACINGQGPSLPADQCLQNFRTEHPSYKVEKTVYDDPYQKIFLFESDTAQQEQ